MMPLLYQPCFQKGIVIFMQNIAIVGATGVVGKELLSILEERNFPTQTIRFFASLRSKDKTVSFKNRFFPIEVLNENAIHDLDLTFFCAGSRISKEWIPHWRGTVIDLSSAFRMESHVPLIIPEINGELLEKRPLLIASPNCSATVLLMPLFPLHKKYQIKRIVLSTYQAASGAGFQFLNELKQETKALSEDVSYPNTLPFPIAFNLFLHNSQMTSSGYVEEEEKIEKETQKILNNSSILISATAVRVPVLRAHSISMNVEFHSPVDLEEVYRLLQGTDGVKVFEDREKGRYPTPFDASHKDEVLVGRVRKDKSLPNTLELWAVGDQLRKGASLNAVQIAEKLSLVKA